MLEVKNLTQKYGDFCAHENISFILNDNEILGIIGPNGAGKTTLINSITGYNEKTTGQVEIDKINILGKRPNVIAKMGLARTFQNIKLFSDLTVFEHLKVANIKGDKAFFDDILNFMAIYDFKDELATNLSYGDCRRVEIARALSSKPKILILDEPGAGMNDIESEELSKQILKIREKYKTSIIIIEHDMSIIKSCCDRVLVLNYGHKIAEGTFLEIENNSEVRKAYLGE